MTRSGTPSVVIAHEHRLFGECLSAALSDEPELGDVHLVTDPRDVSLKLDMRRPDVVLVRPATPRAATAEVCADIRESHPDIRVVVLDDAPDPELLLICMEAGANGYTTFEEDLSTLVRTVRRVQEGETVVPPLMLGGLLEGLIRRRRAAEEAAERFRALTPREREVLRLLVDGNDHADIAEELVVSEHTARTHIQNLLNKLEVHSRVEAVALAVTSGWIEPRTQAGTSL